jgi:hypothetical protein
MNNWRQGCHQQNLQNLSFACQPLSVFGTFFFSHPPRGLLMMYTSLPQRHRHFRLQRRRLDGHWGLTIGANIVVLMVASYGRSFLYGAYKRHGIQLVAGVFLLSSPWLAFDTLPWTGRSGLAVASRAMGASSGAQRSSFSSRNSESASSRLPILCSRCRSLAHILFLFSISGCCGSRGFLAT